jgi:hypothetical protein
MLAPGDALISLDADLQDDISVLRDMLREFAAGHEIVYGVRSDRRSDTRFKRLSAALHYRLTALLGVETVPDHAQRRTPPRAEHLAPARRFPAEGAPVMGGALDPVDGALLAFRAGSPAGVEA